MGFCCRIHQQCIMISLHKQIRNAGGVSVTFSRNASPSPIEIGVTRVRSIQIDCRKRVLPLVSAFQCTFRWCPGIDFENSLLRSALRTAGILPAPLFALHDPGAGSRLVSLAIDGNVHPNFYQRNPHGAYFENSTLYRRADGRANSPTYMNMRMYAELSFEDKLSCPTIWRSLQVRDSVFMLAWCAVAHRACFEDSTRLATNRDHRGSGKALEAGLPHDGSAKAFRHAERTSVFVLRGVRAHVRWRT